MNETDGFPDRPLGSGRTSVDLETNPTGGWSNSHAAGAVPPSVRVGDVLRNRYVLEERLGSGGKGTVFKALDRYRCGLPEDDRYVAIKILHANPDHRVDLRADLRREFYCAQGLSHESIINVFELDRDGDLDFFTMELLEGELLSSAMARLQPLPLARPQAWAIIRDIGAGLAHAHARNVVHADLKPQNILLTHSGEVRILDFGASSHAAGRQSGDLVYRKNAPSSATPSYASCELLAGRPPDPRDDVYALACLSYELLAGVHPFQRRPATEARDLGIVPKRPPGLTRQQWQTLAMGLSWHRAGRSISVRNWLNRMNIGREATHRVPGVHDLRTAPANHDPTATLRATTLFAVLLITVSVWVLFVRLATGSRSADDAAVAQMAATPQPGQAPEAESRDGVPADSGVRTAALSPPSPPIHPQPSNDRGHEVVAPKQPTGPVRPVVVSASNYTVRSGEHFAEIRVHRSPLLRGDGEFVWWTEAASAKPGIDYVQPGKVIQSFPKGKNSTSFFIKLVPGVSRERREVFYVAIAETGRGNSVDPVARAAVWLPTNQQHSQPAVEPEIPAVPSKPGGDSRFSTAALGVPLTGSK